MIKETLQELYRTCVGALPADVKPLPAAGSGRCYYRMDGLRRLIGVCGTSVRENEAFVYMSRHFRSKGLPVPEVVGCSADRMCYLQEDLGDVNLFDAIAQGRATGLFSEAEKDLLRKTICRLPALQVEGAEGFDFGRCYPQAAFDRRSVLWDLNYFKYCFLKATGAEFREDRLEDDFQSMADVLLADGLSDTFMHRDFQSRNVMLCDGEPWFIDFQGGRRGPFLYDVVSFLWQARANLPDELRAELLAEYLDALRRYRSVDEAWIRGRLRHFVLFRTLQVLGAYGFRGYFERKPHFLQSVPYALTNLRRLFDEGDFAEYPSLCAVLRVLTKSEALRDVGKPLLTVTVTSFSYRKGIPADSSGNGGGFVFDCRAVNNPGRYERYKSLTGMDEPVARFLEEDGEIFSFLAHAYALVDASVARYRERGFTSLSVCFGCTGGRHRSVYSARRMAEHLGRIPGVRVVLTHRELDITRIMEAVS